MCSPQSGPFRDVHRVTQRREEEGDRGGQEDKRGNQKERDRSSQYCSLSVFHSPEHTKRFTELGREEKGEGGDKGGLVEKKQSPKGRELSSQ